jgi:hypothetical protein
MKFDDFDDPKYDRQMIQLLDLLRQIDLDQFTNDLLINDKQTFYRLKELMTEKGRITYYAHKT